MLSFENDYSEGAHPQILQRLLETNLVQQPGYGEDAYTLSAKEKIRTAIGDPQADIFFLSGGTQANRTVISALLSTTQGIVAAETGHINVHESGAIESTGHKVIPLPQHDGKVDAGELRRFLESFYADPTWPHMAIPGMLYISHPTEWGTLYAKEELTALRAVCDGYGLPLFLDGARLGYGLVSRETDVTLPDVARLCDVFYIGGTKVGALCGEAVVFPRRGAPKGFFSHVKQQGALTAKGRLLGVQFDALFTDDLYFEISRRAAETAEKMKAGFAARGYRFFLPSPTNQQFVILENGEMNALSRRVRFSLWGPFDETHSVVRFATSWATTEEQVDRLMTILDETRGKE